jgi:homing endonuclease-like protein
MTSQTDNMALLAGTLLPSSSPSPSYMPDLSESSDSSPELPGLDWEAAKLGLDWDREGRALTIESLRAACMADPQAAVDILDHYRPKSTQAGWCSLISLKPSKSGGYIQLSWGGANKFAVLQEVVLWARGLSLTSGEDCSHLCHNPRCISLEHIINEQSVINQSRKNCLVWLKCHHCKKYIFTCSHKPYCIKYCEGYRDLQHFLNEGCCMIINKI